MLLALTLCMAFWSLRTFLFTNRNPILSINVHHHWTYSQWSIYYKGRTMCSMSFWEHFQAWHGVMSMCHGKIGGYLCWELGGLIHVVRYLPSKCELKFNAQYHTNTS
jgi:hypothetical protein